MKTHKLERSRANGRRVSVLVAAVLAAASFLPSITQAASQAPVLVPVSGPAAKQTPDDARFSDSAVQAKVKRDAGRLSLSVQTAEGASRSVELDEAIYHVAAIHRFESQLIVLGTIAEGGATEVCIVNWTNGRVVDRFWAYDPAVSPDASMIAFVRFYPLHFTEGVESQYRLYRLRSSAEANRSFYKGQQAGTDHEHADAGQPVFAESKSRVPRANIGVSDAQARTHLSRLAWSADSRRFGVIDAHGRTVRALVMQVSADGAEGLPMVQPVDGLNSVCLPARSEECDSLPFDAVSLSFEAAGDSLRLKINDRSLFPKGFAKTLPLKAFAPLP